MLLCRTKLEDQSDIDAVVYPYEADSTGFKGGVHHLAIQRYLKVDPARF